MKSKKLAFGVLIIAVIFLAVGVGKLYSDFKTRDHAEQQYESLAELARETTAGETKASIPEAETSAAYVSPIDFEKLGKINPDIVGWIRIEGTAIDYPHCADG